MRFATGKQLLTLALIWAAVLFAGDFIKNPGSFHGYKSAPIDKPRVTLFMPHMCCSGCLEDLRGALAHLHWIGAVDVVKTPEPEPDDAEVRYDKQVTLEILDVEQIDFVALDRTIRDTGLAAEQIVVDGIPHFRLEAAVPHICCKACAGALDQGFDLAKRLPSVGRLPWFDSATVSKERKTVTVFAKYDGAVDVTELLAAFNRLGFAPRSLHVLRGDGSAAHRP